MVLVLKAGCAVLSVNISNESEAAELTGLISYLVRDRLLDADEARSAMNAAQHQGISVTSYLVRSQILSSHTIMECCVKHFGLPIYDLKNFDPACLRDSVIKPEIIYRYRVIPLNTEQNSLYLGITDPTDQTVISAIGFQTGLRIRPMLVAEVMLDEIINTYCRPNILYSQLETALSKMVPIEEQESHLENIEQSDEPVIEFVDRLINDAVDKNISDIHIEQYEHHSRIRFRRDGLLYEAAIIPPHLAARVTTRLKIMAHLNIAERRLPQDGRIRLKQESKIASPKIDIRINACPTLYGEKIVLRILNANYVNLNIDSLGLTQAQKKLFLAKLSQPQGLILVTGPTGSGKTLTLYSALNYLNRIEKNISTVEDPVEIELPGINQVNINTKIGLDFASILRTFLRQDPDIIMVGEIRDPETANIAMQAAQTGHLVLSTMHTNSAAETITRLQSLGIAAYHLISSVALIIAQRLVRKLCKNCKQPEILPAECTPFNISYRPIGCEYCCGGYQGRIGIFELIPVTEKIAHVILSGANVHEILDQAKREKCTFLWDAGTEKVRDGITSLSELIKVAGK